MSLVYTEFSQDKKRKFKIHSINDDNMYYVTCFVWVESDSRFYMTHASERQYKTLNGAKRYGRKEIHKVKVK